MVDQGPLDPDAHSVVLTYMEKDQGRTRGEESGKEMKKRTLLSWSSGKDSAWALHILRQDPGIEVLGVFAAMNEKLDRVSMHSTRRELLQRQAEAIGLPLQTINLPDSCSNRRYDVIMRRFIEEAVGREIRCIAFGDLFLEEVRKYREIQLSGTGIDPLFPLWSIPTSDLAEQMLFAGTEAYISSIDLKKLSSRCAGRKWSRELIREFLNDYDPCGENGEIHTVVVGGPIFRRAVPVRIGETVERNDFAYADIIPMN
jgi:uncharacterized protein (TIGR00290 family)